MIEHIGRALVFAIVFAFAQNARGADLVSRPPFLYIIGAIDKPDIAKVETIVRQPDDVFFIRINSGGGNVEAAMAIGRLLRKMEKVISVEAGDRCASACIFVLAGSVDRIVEGDVIIHRPYLTQELADDTGYDEQYKRTEQRIRSYFAEMNIPGELADRMMAVPPDEGEVLTTIDLNRYMLNGKDPAYEQKLAAAEAKRWGISLAEQRRRQMLQKTVCGFGWSGEDIFDGVTHHYCEEAIMRGDDPRTVQARVRLTLQRRAAIVRLPEGLQDNCTMKFILGTEGPSPRDRPLSFDDLVAEANCPLR